MKCVGKDRLYCTRGKIDGDYGGKERRKGIKVKEILNYAPFDQSGNPVKTVK